MVLGVSACARQPKTTVSAASRTVVRGATPRPSAIAREADFRRFTDYLWAALGAGAALVVHELGHTISDGLMGKDIHFIPAYLGPFPFFAIEPCCSLTPREQAIAAAGGFFTQHLGTELILWGHPELRAEHQPFLKGMLFFNIGLSLGYGITALAGIGPPTSDIQTWSRALERSTWQSGVMLVVPALLDVYRYLVPHSRWAPWVSLSAKLTMLGATIVF